MIAAMVLAYGCAGRPATAPTPAAPSPQAPLKNIRYTIQVGAFSTTARAAAYENRLAADGVDAYYFIDEDGLSKVRFGRFDTKREALDFAKTLVAKGIIEAYYIVRPRPPGPGGAPVTERRRHLADTASRFIGTPYRWGGTSAASGFDCSGLTMTVYRLNGLELPRTARDQYLSGTTVARENLAQGDLVFFKTPGRRRISHVGIYIGDGRFIHASGSGKTIRTASLANPYFQRHFAGGRRYF